MKLKFLGATREVTGSKHLITTQNGKKILLDCGMFQGKGLETDGMNRNLGFDPVEIDHILLSLPPATCALSCLPTAGTYRKVTWKSLTGAVLPEARLLFNRSIPKQMPVPV
ncbi:MAG: hypothetical protein LUQ05_04045 [Methanoregula sp.]|nr:hypothetical protein [Methanoregula sp.]